MQWKSFVFTLATAGSALANTHGQHNHRHGVRHHHEERSVQGAVEEVAGFFEQEPLTVTETAWECCTTSTFSFTPTTAPTTSVEIPTETPEPEPTTTSTPVVEEPTSTPTPEPTPEPVPEPETTSSTSTSSTSTVAPTSTVKPPASSTAPDHSAWTNFPSNGDFCFDGFGGRTAQQITDNKFIYQGNVGNPWGSNIIEVSAEEAANYKYVVQFHGSKTDKWTVVVWNKIGPDFKMTGWYGNSAVSFSLEPEEIRYVAFDENSQGSWGAAPGDSLPTDEYGGYSCTWGEFDLGSEVNNGWSGWDVSAIQAQAAGAHVQGMKMCSHEGDNCSIITTGAAKVIDAYLEKDKWVDGIGGKVVPGPVRIVTHLDYNE